MTRKPFSDCLFWLIATTSVLVVDSGSVVAQPAFSISFQGPMPTRGAVESCPPGNLILEGDPLFPPGGVLGLAPPVLGLPCVYVSGGPGGLGLAPYPTLAALPAPGTSAMIEVDAISYGFDLDPMTGCAIAFSVDQFAVGLPLVPTAPLGPPATVNTEGAFGALEAAADLFLMQPVTTGFPPYCFGFNPNFALLDGNGAVSASGWIYPGVGLIEPYPPTPGAAPPHPGDNLDAMASAHLAGPFPVYFSLDSAFVDPLTPGANSGSAAAHGFVGGDVLVTSAAGAAPAIYASAALLGLDQFGADTDDLDALALLENGVPGYQPSLLANDWAGGATDMLLFSVRRGSAVIGAIDSLCGLPIEEGDVLTTPQLGGVSPGIYICAEMLGLATLRSGALTFSYQDIRFADDVDALDFGISFGVTDCNGNGVDDGLDIAAGTSADCNANGVPDECDIYNGTSIDSNFNGIPDSCEPFADCNANGTPDYCDLQCAAVDTYCSLYVVCTATDCNFNGIPDSCDIASGVLADTDGDGIPNACECPADVNSDGAVNVADLLAVIGAWGPCAAPCPPFCAGDIIKDCTVNATDLLAVIAAWGPCP
ncbi:MAG: dockerin type I domain-containing protein [Phycisphaerales bacterium]|nr:dockerin type I domain-containing protein [Phycisphaerales bacterium]